MAGTISTIIFDFDGTLADTLEAGVAILNSLADRFGFKKISADNVKSLQNKLPREMLKDVGISLWKLPFVARTVRKQLTVQMPLLKPYPGIRDAFDRLKAKNIRLGILTTGSLENAKIFLKSNGLEKYFDFVYAESNLFGKGKVLKKLMAKYQIDPSLAVYVGDEVRDIEAARKAGIKIVSATWGVNSKNILRFQQPDWIIEKPEEILKLI